MLRKKTAYAVTSMFMAVLLIVLSISAPVGALTEVSATKVSKIDSALKEKMETASPDEKIPVAIWYSDVDQDNIDRLTAQKVGFTQDDVAIAYEMPSNDLLSSLEKEEAGANEEMQSYLARTERFRELERKRTDEYIMTRREFSRSKYNEKSAKVIKDIDLEEKDIVFKSQYAPMILTKLTKNQIVVLSKKSSLEMICYSESTEEEHLLSNMSVVAYNNEIVIDSNIDIIQRVIRHRNVVEALEVSGEGVNVGVIESGGLTVADTDLNNTTVISVGDNLWENGTHITSVVKIIAGATRGFAKGVNKVFCTNTDYPNMEMLLSQTENPINIINISHASSNGTIYYANLDKWIDHIVAQHNVTVVVAASNNGDEDGQITSPARAYNVITVGSYFVGPENNDGLSEPATLTTDDDKLALSSSYNNGSCIEKPDVIMPYVPPNGATSLATPILTGCLALMFELKPSLSLYPQAVKAITLASCHKKLPASSNGEPSEDIYDGITDRQGAGAPDILTMAAIVCNGTYGVRILEENITQNSIRFVQPSYGAESMNVSISWLRDNKFEENNDNHTSNEGLGLGAECNLDLFVYRNISQVGVSLLPNSSTEMAYFDLGSKSNYELRVVRNSNSINTSVKYGYAYSTDYEQLTPITEEGIYRIKSLSDGRYMTLDTSNNEIKLQDYVNSDLQYWILKKTTAYQISSAHEDAVGIINRGSQYGMGNKAILGTSYLNFSILDWENNSIEIGSNGSSEIYTYINGNRYVLSYFENNVTVSSMENSSEKRFWLLEKVNYKKGDVDVDGELTDDDILLIRLYISESVTLNNMQSFLADFDNNGVVNISDATAIEQLID